ncbi:MAG: hypothetical protein NC244_10915 [Alistipes senegalensis]|nr:hypothetical protein [Alistipes senegalensis]
MNDFKLITTESFENGIAEKGVPCDFWKDGDEYYVTREQIGTALGYSNPRKAIEKIHLKHKERLDKFSFICKSNSSNSAQSGGIDSNGSIQERTFYTRKGIMEICRWSRQSTANKFMDWAYDIIDKLIAEGISKSKTDVSENIKTEIKKQVQTYVKRTPWKKQITRKVRTLAYYTSYGTSDDTRPIYSQIYMLMRSEGYDIERYKEKYLEMYPDTIVHVFGIDIIEEFDELKTLFEKILDEYLVQELQIKKHNHKEVIN